MSNELTIFQAITSAGQAISSMAQSVKALKTINKQDSVIFKEQLQFIKYACRARGYGELIRLSVDEVQRTYSIIELNSVSSEVRAMSMALLEMQYKALEQNIRRYMSN